MVLYLREDRGRIALRVHTGNVERLVGQVGDTWSAMMPGQPFSITFMDDEFNRAYEAEQRMGGISLSFSLLAIFIACLGLFGLAAYAAEQRTREIGIRKVLGATVGGVVPCCRGTLFGWWYSRRSLRFRWPGGHASLVAGLCLSDHYRLGDLCAGGRGCAGYCFANGELSGGEGGAG